MDKPKLNENTLRFVTYKNKKAILYKYIKEYKDFLIAEIITHDNKKLEVSTKQLTFGV